MKNKSKRMRQVFVIFGRRRVGGMWETEFSCTRDGKYEFTKSEAHRYMKEAFRIAEKESALGEKIELYLRKERYYTM